MHRQVLTANDFANGITRSATVNATSIRRLGLQLQQSVPSVLSDVTSGAAAASAAAVTSASLPPCSRAAVSIPGSEQSLNKSGRWESANKMLSGSSNTPWHILKPDKKRRLPKINPYGQRRLVPAEMQHSQTSASFGSHVNSESHAAALLSNSVSAAVLPRTPPVQSCSISSASCRAL